MICVLICYFEWLNSDFFQIGIFLLNLFILMVQILLWLVQILLWLFVFIYLFY